MCSKIELDRITETVARTARSIFSDKLEKIVLYGSYARGDYDRESDIDIMILIDMSAESLIHFRSDINELASDLSLSTEDCSTVSILLQDKETFNRYRQALPFFANVLREGVTIYAA